MRPHERECPSCRGSGSQQLGEEIWVCMFCCGRGIVDRVSHDTFVRIQAGQAPMIARARAISDAESDALIDELEETFGGV